jgi:hypothetical protein
MYSPLTTDTVLSVQQVPFKMEPKTITTVKKFNQKHIHPCVIDCPSLPMTLKPRSPSLPGRCARQLRKSCVGANIVYVNITLHPNSLPLFV